jgi:hypothetical protein
MKREGPKNGTHQGTQEDYRVLTSLKRNLEGS